MGNLSKLAVVMRLFFGGNGGKVRQRAVSSFLYWLSDVRWHLKMNHESDVPFIIPHSQLDRRHKRLDLIMLQRFFCDSVFLFLFSVT